MNKKSISTDSLEDDMRGFSTFGAFPAKAVPAAGNVASAKTEDPATPDDNGNTDKTSKRCKTGNAGATRNTTRQSKTSKNGNTDKLVAKTYKLPPRLIELVDRVAYWQRRNKQDVIAEALLKYFEAIPEEDKAEIKRKR